MNFEILFHFQVSKNTCSAPRKTHHVFNMILWYIVMIFVRKSNDPGIVLKYLCDTDIYIVGRSDQ